MVPAYSLQVFPSKSFLASVENGQHPSSVLEQSFIQGSSGDVFWVIPSGQQPTCVPAHPPIRQGGMLTLKISTESFKCFYRSLAF